MALGCRKNTAFGSARTIFVACWLNRGMMKSMYGPPLVMKSDNGGQFRADETKDLLAQYQVVPLDLPPTLIPSVMLGIRSWAFLVSGNYFPFKFSRWYFATRSLFFLGVVVLPKLLGRLVGDPACLGVFCVTEALDSRHATQKLDLFCVGWECDRTQGLAILDR